MLAFEDGTLSDLTLMGTTGSICVILLRCFHQHLALMRRDALELTEKLRQDLREHDNTLFALQALVADTHLTIAKLEEDLTHLRQLLAAPSLESGPNQESKPKAAPSKPKTKSKKTKKRTSSDPES